MHRRHLNPSIDQRTQFSYLGVPAPAEGRRRNVALGLVPSQGNGGVHGRHLNPSINPCTQSSYLGVPAPAEGRRRNVGLGLVPSQERGGGHRRHLNPSINPALATPEPVHAQSSYLGVPAPAEGQRRNVGLGLVPSQGKGGEHWRHLNPSINPYTQSSYLGVPAPAEGQRRNVGLGLVPSQGKGGEHWRHLNPSINPYTQFSYLGVPAYARATLLTPHLRRDQRWVGDMKLLVQNISGGV